MPVLNIGVKGASSQKDDIERMEISLKHRYHLRYFITLDNWKHILHASLLSPQYILKGILEVTKNEISF